MKHIILTLISLFCMSVISCSKDDPTIVGGWYDTLEFDIDGVDLRQTSDVHYKGELPQSGARFVITGKGKNVKDTFISMLIINGVIQNPDKVSLQNGVPWLEAYGDWGNISYLTHEPPYKMEFVITPNETDKVRKIEISLGYGYWYASITLTQLSK